MSIAERLDGWFPGRWPASLRRRSTGFSLVVVSASFVGIYAWYRSQTLSHDASVTGWVMIAALIVLAALGIRRRLVSLPLAPVGLWVQAHVYLGIFFLLAYLMHVPRIIANGGLELILSLLVIATIGSGIYGWYLSRTAPRRLTAIGQEVRYDQIDWTRARIAVRAAALIGSLSDSEDREVLSRHYQQNIDVYFTSKPSWWYFIMPTGSRRRRLLAGLIELNRYLSPELRAVAGELSALVRNRDDLDYHHAIQWRLRSWRGLHALMTVVLILFATTHVILALRMMGV